jgi:hypothetical protein
MAEKWTIQALGEQLAIHIAKDEDRDEKIDGLYKTVVVGNGCEPMTRTVGRNTEWINSVKRFLWLGITALVGAVVTGSLSLAYMIIRIYPLLQAIDRLDLIHVK